MKKYLQTLIILCVFGQIAKGQADLTFVPNSLVVSPTTQHIGLPITITMSVQNIGDEASGICRTRIFYSPTPNYGDSLLFADISLEALAAGATSTNIQFVHPIPYNFTGGTYYFFIELNHFGDITESNYFNNEAVSDPITINPAPWAAQNIPYPIIFIHGLIGSNTTWYPLINDLKNIYGWSYGGNMNFCLNQDGNLFTANLSYDYHDYTNINDLQPDDFFTVNFNVDNYGATPPNIDVESNQSAIVKQGLAIRDAVAHVREVTGRDKVILVGHSMGGLAAREYLQNPYIQPPVNQHHVAKLTTIGTPNGGSNLSLLGLFGLATIDELSEAVRDLRYPFFPLFLGAYLFDGNENTPQLTLFHNLDVNCNGSLGDDITGINHKGMPYNVIYSSLIGTGSPLGGDGVVSEDRANLNNYPLPPYSVIADTFNLIDPGVNFPWHLDLNKQTMQVIKGLDEPNNNINGHAYLVSSGQVYYGIISYQSNNNAARDFDHYKINIPSNGNLNIQVYNILLSQFYINVFNSSSTPVYSIKCNGKSFINVNTPTLSAGNYYVTLSGYPNCYPNSETWKDPYAFKLTYSPTAIAYCSGTTTLHAPTGTMTDGSGNNDYENNSDCRWKIKPSGATSITLTFSSFDVSNPGDTVYVYDGGTMSSPLLLAWTGDTIPDSVTSTGGTMLVRFFTDASITAPGWTANYTSTIIPTCCDWTTTLFTASSGIFSDASGPGNYANNTNCTWLISIPGAFAITLNFSDFQTEPINDLVNIYDGNDNSAPLLGSFSGSAIPPSLSSSGGAVFVEFISNDTITSAGWTASYTSLIPSTIDGIVKYEYWFDNDYSSKIGNSVSMQNTVNLITSFPTTGLNTGLHNLHIRFKDNKGQWSSVISEVFHKLPPSAYGNKKITAYEYWFDNQDTSRVLTNVTPVETFSLIDSIEATSLPIGLHGFHIRFKDDAGLWSPVVSEVFYKLRITASLPNLITAYRYLFDGNISSMQSFTVVPPLNPYHLIDTIVTPILSVGNHTIHFQFTDIFGSWSCVTTDTFNVAFALGGKISGIYTYNNTSNTLLDSVWVILKLNGPRVDSVRTNLAGSYLFESKLNDIYTISSRTNKPWNGVNATDAIKVLRHFAGLEPLTEPVRLLAGDVNLSNSINATDATKIKRRFCGLDTSFVRGDWTFSKPTVGGDTIIVNGSDVIQNFYGLCVGDVNGSNIPSPGDFFQMRVTMENNGMIEVLPGQEFELPIRAKTDLTLSAISLVIPYPTELLELLSILSNPVNPVYNIANGELRFAWSELQPFNLKAGETLLILKLRAKESFTGNQTIELHPTSESELADDAGEAIDLAELDSYIIKPLKPIGIEEFNDLVSSCSVYPNPAQDILYILPVKTVKADIYIYNSLGTIVMSQKGAELLPSVKLDISNLSPGVYIISINSNDGVQIRKLVIKK